MKLQANNVSFRYSENSCWVLRNVNFSMESGEHVGLFAPSGYGKSTFARLLAGFSEPSEGQILLNNVPLPKKGVCPVQLIFQHPEKAINPRWRLSQVLDECGGPSREILDAFGIETPWLNRRPGALSGGELQRFNIARAMLSNPDFLICDEISTMLDTITQAQIWQAVLQIAEKKNMGLLVVTHNLSLAKRICSRIYDLSAGQDLNDF